MANDSTITASTPAYLKTYLVLTYHIPEEQYEQAYTALAFTEHCGITEGMDELSICFEFIENNVQERIIDDIDKKFILNNVQCKLNNVETIIEKNWNKEWEDSIEPIHINDNIVVTPSWKADSVNATVSAPIVLVINPQMSFGSGHHETTSMMAELIQETVQPGSFWIDAGTGTGLLAILAVRCGAQRVFAFDNDEWSVLNTRENIERNPIPLEAIHVEQADVFKAELPLSHGIAANLHKNLIKPNLSRFYDALRSDVSQTSTDAAQSGHLLLSGILRYDADDIITAAIQAGFRHRQTKAKGDWIALHLVKSHV